MAKSKKRSIKTSASKKPAKNKTAKKAAAKKSMVKKAAAPKKAATKKAPARSAAPAAKKTAARASVAAPKREPVKQVRAKPVRPEPPARQTIAQSDASPDARKKLAAQHMWDLVQAKKQRATQTPAWKTIVHHDHPVPRTSPDLSTDQGGSSMPPEMPGHRDRGTG